MDCLQLPFIRAEEAVSWPQRFLTRKIGPKNPNKQNEFESKCSSPLATTHVAHTKAFSMTFHFRQNSMFHFTLYFVQSIVHFLFVISSLHSWFNFFAFNIQLWFMQHSSFRFRHSTFHKQQSSFLIRSSSSVECTTHYILFFASNI